MNSFCFGNGFAQLLKFAKFAFEVFDRCGEHMERVAFIAPQSGSWHRQNYFALLHFPRGDNRAKRQTLPQTWKEWQPASRSRNWSIWCFPHARILEGVHERVLIEPCSISDFGKVSKRHNGARIDAATDRGGRFQLH
jgi:hypothetical protein